MAIEAVRSHCHPMPYYGWSPNEPPCGAVGPCVGRTPVGRVRHTRSAEPPPCSGSPSIIGLSIAGLGGGPCSAALGLVSSLPFLWWYRFRCASSRMASRRSARAGEHHRTKGGEQASENAADARQRRGGGRGVPPQLEEAHVVAVAAVEVFEDDLVLGDALCPCARGGRGELVRR